MHTDSLELLSPDLGRFLAASEGLGSGERAAVDRAETELFHICFGKPSRVRERARATMVEHFSSVGLSFSDEPAE